MKPILSLAALALAAAPALAGPVAPPAMKDFLAGCSLQESDFGFNLKRTTQGPATVFVARKDGNAFQLCVNGRQTLFGQGLIVPGTIAEDDGDLVFETVQPKKNVPGEDAAAGALKNGEWQAGGRSYELTGRFKHRIPLERMTAEAFSIAGNSMSLEQAAWLTVVAEPKGKPRAAAVRLKDDDGPAGEKLARRALGLRLDSSFQDAASVDKIVQFVASELPKHAKSGGPLVKTPMVYVELAVNKTAQESEPAPVVDIVARGRRSGTDSRGEPIVDALDYDQLLYCRQEARLETRREHNAHLSAAARMAAGK